jgi:hypothetical protein
MTISNLLFGLLDKFEFPDQVTLVVFGFAVRDPAGSRVRQAVAAIRSAWVKFAAAIQRWGRGDHDRYLAASVDRFDLERRERAWCRDQRRGGSLIGW